MFSCVIQKLGTRKLFIAALILLISVTLNHFSSETKARNANQPKREVHALWAHPPAVGNTPEAVRKFIEGF